MGHCFTSVAVLKYKITKEEILCMSLKLSAGQWIMRKNFSIIDKTFTLISL